VLRPALALITNVGTAHIGIIGTKERIAEEKKSVFSFFTGDETAFIPAGSECAAFLSSGVNGNVCFYPDADEVFEDVKDRGILGWECTIASAGNGNGEYGGNGPSGGIRTRFPLPGRHNLENAAAAVALARALGIGAKAIAAGLSSVKPLPGRGEVAGTTLGGRAVTVVNDGYNANPDSMEKALTFFDETPWTGRKIVVAGEMLELGARSKEEHEKLFSRLEAVNADKKYFFHVSDAAFQDGDVAVYDDIEALKAAIADDAQEGDLVLLKGSRSCGLERVLEREEMRDKR
jgi:UDP-N-acetylmuramoyl-tripeptide--D-alanyl-D-alanine ligase